MGRVTPMLFTFACGIAQFGKLDFFGAAPLPRPASLAASRPTVGPDDVPRWDIPSLLPSSLPKPGEPPGLAASVWAAALPGVVGSTVRMPVSLRPPAAVVSTNELEPGATAGI